MRLLRAPGRPVTVAWAVLVALGALGAGCSSDSTEAPRPGTALADTASDSLTEIELPPAQEVVVLVKALRNVSGLPLEITKLRAIPGSGVPESAQIVQVSLITATSDFRPGIYVTYPPVTRRQRSITRTQTGCVRASVRAPRGVVIQPEQEPLVLVWLRAVGDGRASVTGLRVDYVQGEAAVPYTQEVTIDGPTVLEVDGAAVPIEPARDESACASEVRFLPGSVRY